MTYLQTQGERNVGDIAEDMNLTISTASRHLTLLARTGILHMRRDGTMRYYTVNSQGLDRCRSRAFNNLANRCFIINRNKLKCNGRQAATDELVSYLYRYSVQIVLVAC